MRSGDPRTTNSVESWHRTFAHTFGSEHLGVYKLIEKLRDDQNSQEIALIHLDRGDSSKRRKKYEMLDARLHTIVERYSEQKFDVAEFLRNIAVNVDLNP